MSGQFTESCQTHEGAHRNQCRDSLQSHVGPMKTMHPQKVCPIMSKRRAIKRRAQSIKRRAIKRRAQFIKRCAGFNMARHVSALAGAPVCRLAASGARYAWLPRYLTKVDAEAEADKKTSENPLKTTLPLLRRKLCNTL